MRSKFIALAVLTASLVLSCGYCPAQTNVVSLRSLLNEMTDRDQIAQWPAAVYFLKQQSSYHRDSKTPADPEGWFANGDRGQFIRIEENQGRKEWVLMDYAGPGAMGRTWMPDPRITPMVLSGRQQPPNASDLGILRVYLDGQAEPVIEGPTYDVLHWGYPLGDTPPMSSSRALS